MLYTNKIIYKFTAELISPTFILHRSQFLSPITVAFIWLLWRTSYLSTDSAHIAHTDMTSKLCTFAMSVIVYL
jgi:hypothetical protein